MMTIVITVFYALFAIGLTVSVLAQSGKSAGLGTISGGATQVFGKKKGMDETLSRVTTILAILFIVTSLLLTYLETRAL
jgi:preprotein translocase subunit SecG